MAIDSGGEAETPQSQDAAPEPSPVPLFRLFYAFLPETAMLRQVRFQLVVASRSENRPGSGVLWRVGRGRRRSLRGVAYSGCEGTAGGDAGNLGGAVADALPRRIALGFGYAGQAALCVFIPVFFGTDFAPLLLLVAGVSCLNSSAQAKRP
jgi:hypothetical protein